jgi:hemerythrin
MSSLQWGENLLTGDLAVDAQHRVLVGALLKIQTALATNQKDESLATLIPFLERYAVEHFACEERLMIAVNYPYFEEHHAIHEELASTIHAVVKNFQHNPNSFTSTICGEIVNTLESHIANVDMKMIAFIKK